MTVNGGNMKAYKLLWEITGEDAIIYEKRENPETFFKSFIDNGSVKIIEIDVPDNTVFINGETTDVIYNGGRGSNERNR
jgi:hypothetical protein